MLHSPGTAALTLVPPSDQLVQRVACPITVPLTATAELALRPLQIRPVDQWRNLDWDCLWIGLAPDDHRLAIALFFDHEIASVGQVAPQCGIAEQLAHAGRGPHGVAALVLRYNFLAFAGDFRPPFVVD